MKQTNVRNLAEKFEPTIDKVENVDNSSEKPGRVLKSISENVTIQLARETSTQPTIQNTQNDPPSENTLSDIRNKGNFLMNIVLFEWSCQVSFWSKQLSKQDPKSKKNAECYE